MNGFYLIDKPLWLTSFDVIRKLKKILWTSRIWHAWTLDPLASGLLLVAVGEYTKLLNSILLHDKVYEFSILLDGKSDSYDVWTPVKYISQEDQEKAKKSISLSSLNDFISHNFIGKIMQIPPKYSALKINGKKSLIRAKSWEDFELKAREIEIFSFEILDYSYPHVFCRARVSSWTYIRSLASDMWSFFWTWGYVGSLRRIHLWKINISQAQDLEHFSAENTLSLKEIFSPEHFVHLDSEIIHRLNMWQRVRLDRPLKQNIPLFVSDDSNVKLICNYDGKILFPIRRLNTQEDF